MEKIINRLINDEVAGVDIYTNAGSTWLIFTETKEWVIELTKKGALWYNYSFFKNLFAYLGFDVVENQHYITKWVENTLQNVVKHTYVEQYPIGRFVEDTIQNGVKKTLGVEDGTFTSIGFEGLVENTLQNGVKHTYQVVDRIDLEVEDTLQNGVKHTEPGGYLGSIEMKGEIVHQLCIQL